MSLENAEIAQVVSTIWQSVLGMECAQTTEAPTISPGNLSACVQITGAWQGAVVLGCPREFAVQAATAMFSTPTAECNVTDMQDAVAELTNMIGGNFKGLLPLANACQLSLPAVVAGADYTTRIPGSRPMHRIVMSCCGQIIVVNVLQKLFTAQAA